MDATGALLREGFGRHGLVEMDRLAAKTARATSPATQARLRDVVEILNRVQGWAGSPAQALAWYRSQPLSGFGDRTAEELVKEGRAEAVKRHLGRIAEGGYA